MPFYDWQPQVFFFIFYNFQHSTKQKHTHTARYTTKENTKTILYIRCQTERCITDQNQIWGEYRKGLYNSRNTVIPHHKMSQVEAFMQLRYGVHIRLKASVVEWIIQVKSSRGIICLVIEWQPLMEGDLSLIHDISRFFLANKCYVKYQISNKS